MPKYNQRDLENTIIAQIKEKIANIETDKSVKRRIAWTSPENVLPNHRFAATTAVDLVFDDIKIDIEGFEPNCASMLIELWFDDVVLEDGKILTLRNGKTEEWNGSYKTCWDERNDIWQWYIQTEGKAENIEDFDNTTGYGSGFIDLTAAPDPTKHAGGRIGIDSPIGGKRFARIISEAVLDSIDKSQMDKMARLALETAEPEKPKKKK